MLGRARAATAPAIRRTAEAETEPRAGDRRAYFGPDAGWHDTALLSRNGLSRSPRPGPLVIEEYDATIVVPPGALAWRDDFDNVIIDV